MQAVLSDDDIAQRREAIIAAAHEREDRGLGALTALAHEYKYITPFGRAADDVITALENSDDRFRLGLAEIDVLTRGFGAKELVMITGFSHAGKTQLVNTAILNNPKKRILFFSMDDPAEMILLKLVCMSEGIGAKELERRVRTGDEGAKLMLRQCANHTYGNLIVIDQVLGLGQMKVAVDEATRFWGADPDVVIIDYLNSIAGNHDGDESSSIGGKVTALKQWVKDKPFPTIVIHQQSRTKGGPGQPITIVSGAFGGEAEATMLIGVRRKKDDPDADEYDRRLHAETVTIHVVKNKRPPAEVTEYNGIDFHMDGETGVISSYNDATRLLRSAAVREGQ